ncbi:hypothetical protein [Pelomonas sp. KK5]|nr:hypothetical protein [Pelomonas sp. KK5]
MGTQKDSDKPVPPPAPAPAPQDGPLDVPGGRRSDRDGKFEGDHRPSR